jgi:hypothetical protein
MPCSYFSEIFAVDVPVLFLPNVILRKGMVSQRFFGGDLTRKSETP